MKIAVVCMKYDYGVRTRGYSYEYYNIYMPLADIYGESNVMHFDFYSEFKSSGQEVMNSKLADMIRNEKPDVTVFCLFENEFEEEVISSLRSYTRTVVYFFDDPWRRRYSEHWKKFFDFYSTPDYYMYRRYLLEDSSKVIYSPFGFNKNIYKKLDLEKKYDVSFVGNYSAYREWVFAQLKKEGVAVRVFGRGWQKENPWLSQEDMISVFNQSKINLNLSNAVNKELSFMLWAAKSPKAMKQLLLLKKDKEQVKGRHYEINGCGGFQLSYFVPGLNLVYEIDKEIAVFEDVTNLGDEIKLYLRDEELRKSIAEAGYQRSIQEHTAQNYLKNLVEKAVK